MSNRSAKKRVARARAEPERKLDGPRRTSSAMNVPTERVYERVGLARATIDRKMREDVKLSPDEIERVVGVAQLIGQAQTIVEESGDRAGLDAATWVGALLERPHPALSGRAPGEYLDTAEGRALVSGAARPAALERPRLMKRV